MPTTNPRIALTLPQHRYDLLKRLAELQGVSMASIVSEILETAEPVFERMCVAMEAVKAAPKEMHAGLLSSFLEAESKVMPLLEQAAAQSDLFLSRSEGAASTSAKPSARPPRPQRSEDGRARRGVAAGTGKQAQPQKGKGADPRPVITGVRHKVPSKATPRKGKSS
jgi:hypothetical protein